MPDGKLTLRPIAPAELWRWWPMVRAGLDECVLSDWHEPMTEDVYMACRMGKAVLYLALREADMDYFVGFVVCQLDASSYTGAKAVHVWFVHSAHGVDVIRDGLASLRDIARAAGASKIVFTSPRRGWGRAIGATEIETRYQLGVDDDGKFEPA